MGTEVMLAHTGAIEVPNDIPEDTKGDKQPERLMTVGMIPHQQFDIIRVNSIGEYYWKPKSEEMYHHLDKHQIEVWARDLWLGIYGPMKPKDLTDSVEMVKILTKNEINDLSSDCIMVSNNLFWDKEHGEISRGSTAPVFYRLFDTSIETKHVVKVPSFTPEQEERLLERYEQVKAELQRGEEVERYEFLKTWSAGSHDVYMDLHRAHAYMFLKKKPLGSYILIGLKRNGKSSYIGLTHTIVGANNSSNVQLTQLGDPHYTHMLRTTLLNAPDEEEDKAVNAQGFFKSMADHGTLSLPVMRSNVPVQLNCDFMCFFPMNHTPEWKGSGAAACMDRSLIIPFDADLSKYDKTSGNFAKDTFTADMMADYMGSVFAYAWWYHRHDFDFSRTMADEQITLEQDLDSCLTYYKHFMKYFDGFESFKIIYSDYQYWCQAQDVKINTRKELKFVFRRLANSRMSYWHGNGPKRVYRIPESNHKPLMNDAVFSEVEPLTTLHEKCCSVVEELDAYYEKKLES